MVSLDDTKIVVFVSKLTDLSEGSAFNSELMEDQCNKTDKERVALRDLLSTNTAPTFTTTEKNSQRFLQGRGDKSLSI